MIKTFESYQSMGESTSAINHVIKKIWSNVDRSRSRKGQAIWSFELRGYNVEVELLLIGKFEFSVYINDKRMVSESGMDIVSDIEDQIEYLVDYAIEGYDKYILDQENKKRLEDKLSEIDSEEIKMLFDDLNDMDALKDFKIIRRDIYISLNFSSCVVKLHNDGSFEDLEYLKRQEEFYSLLHRTISQIKSLYDVKVFILSRMYNEIYKSMSWELRLIPN